MPFNKSKTGSSLLRLTDYPCMAFKYACVFAIIEHLQICVAPEFAWHYSDTVFKRDIFAGQDKSKPSYKHLTELKRICSVHNLYGIAPDVIPGTDIFENLPVVEMDIRSKPCICKIRATHYT